MITSWQIWTARKSLGWSQKDLAVAAKVPVNVVARAENSVDELRITSVQRSALIATLQTAGAIMNYGGNCDPPDSAYGHAYSVQWLAPGSYDVLLGGVVMASLVRCVDADEADESWHIELLYDVPPSARPFPFENQSHTFESDVAVLEWLGIQHREADSQLEEGKGEQVFDPRTSSNASERYQLRLLVRRNRFYSPTATLKNLIRRGLVGLTGRTDEDGRAELAITAAGRAILARTEP